MAGLPFTAKLASSLVTGFKKAGIAAGCSCSAEGAELGSAKQPSDSTPGKRATDHTHKPDLWALDLT